MRLSLSSCLLTATLLIGPIFALHAGEAEADADAAEIVRLVSEAIRMASKARNEDHSEPPQTMERLVKAIIRSCDQLDRNELIEHFSRAIEDQSTLLSPPNITDRCRKSVTEAVRTLPPA